MTFFSRNLFLFLFCSHRNYWQLTVCMFKFRSPELQGFDLKRKHVSEHAICYMNTLFQWMTYTTTLIGCHTQIWLIAKHIITLSKYMLLQVCIDVIVQRLGDATAAGMYKLLFSNLNGRTSTVSFYALPVCLQLTLILFFLFLFIFGLGEILETFPHPRM